jgi:putative transposase
MAERAQRQPYPTDLSDVEWQRIQPYLPAPKSGGRPRVHTLREILNAIFYIVRSGCTWRMLPHDLPPWKTVYHYFRLWRKDGTWERINSALRVEVRVAAGREPEPSAAVIDSQSVKTTETPGVRGYDAGKKVNSVPTAKPVGEQRRLHMDFAGNYLP